MLPAKMKPVSPQIALQDTGGQRNNGFRSELTAQGRVNIDFGGIQASLDGGLASMDKKANPYSIYPGGDDRFSRLIDWRRNNATLTLTAPISECFSVRGSGYLDTYKDTYISYSDNSFTHEDWRSAIRNRTSGEWLQGDYLFPHAKLTFGQRFENQWYTRHGGSGYENGWTTNWFNLHHLFIQGETGLHQRFGGTAGLGVSTMTLSGRDNTDINLEPAAGIVFRPQHAEISLGYSYNTKYPTMRQLFSASSGNPDLRPESAHKGELRGEYHYGPWTVAQTAFVNRVHDLIDTKGGDYENVGRFLTYGGESSLSVVPVTWWTHSTVFTLLKADPKFSDWKLYNEADYSASIDERVHLPYNLSLSVSADWKNTRRGIDSADRTHMLPVYWVFSTRVEREWNRVTASFAVSNLLDTYYEEEYGYPAAGVDFVLSLGVRL
jgi:hypothetical protein